MYYAEKIYIYAAAGEWHEIKEWIEKKKIILPETVQEPVFYNRWRCMVTAARDIPLADTGFMEELSRKFYMAPMFLVTERETDEEEKRDVRFCWYLSGRRYYTDDPVEIGEMYRKVTEVFQYKKAYEICGLMSAGAMHKVKLNGDGSVRADGADICGECQTDTWRDIVQVSCGEWHTAALKDDGTAVACGSDEEGQCQLSDVSGKIKQISCGRYHTALLMEDGSVTVKGMLPAAPSPAVVQMPEAEEISLSEIFPVTEHVTVAGDDEAVDEMNRNIGNLREGDLLQIRRMPSDGESGWKYCLYDSYGGILGELDGGDYIDAADTEDLEISVLKVVPHLQRPKGERYALLDVRIDVCSEAAGTVYVEKDTEKVLMDPYFSLEKVRCSTEQWPPVDKIISVYDGVIGVTQDNRIYADGFIPCSSEDIVELLRIQRDIAQ